MKKTIAPPVSTPENPLGMNGCQLAVLTARAAPKMKSRIAAILITTIALLARALSRTPRTSIQVSTMISRNAGRLNHRARGLAFDEHGIRERSRQVEAEDVVEQVVEIGRKPTATAMFETAYSRIRSQPMIQAKISPMVA